MEDKVTMIIDCDENTITVEPTMEIPEGAIDLSRSYLIAELIGPDLIRLMKSSNEELMKMSIDTLRTSAAGVMSDLYPKK